MHGDFAAGFGVGHMQGLRADVPRMSLSSIHILNSHETQFERSKISKACTQALPPLSR